MAALVGSVLARLEADASKLDSGLRVGATKVLAFEKRTAASLQRVDARTNATLGLLARTGATGFAGLARSASAAVLPLLSITAALRGARAAADLLGDINDRSLAAGVSPQFFQALAFNAKLSGVEIEGVANALATFNKNSGDLAAGRGRLLTSLKAINPELAKSLQLATSQEQRVKLVADALAHVKDSAQAAAIASAAFGDQGVRLVQVFGQGSAGLDQMVTKAKETGSIFDTELVRRGDELGDKLDAAQQIIDVQLKSALINLGPVLVGLSGLVGNWLRDLNIVLDQMNGIDRRTFVRPLQNQLVGVENAIFNLRGEIEQLKSAPAGGNVLDGVFGGNAEIAAKEKRLADLYDEAARLQERIDELSGKPKTITIPQVPLSPVLVPERPIGGDTLSGRRAVGGTKSGKPLAADDVDHLVTSLKTVNPAVVADNAAVAEMQRQLETATQAGQQFATTFVDDLLDGQDVVTSLSDALAGLGRQLVNMATNAAIASLFTNLFGGASIAGGAAIPSAGFIPGLTGPRLFADGGYTGAGSVTRPAGVVHGKEYVLNAGATSRLGVGLLDHLNNGGNLATPSMPTMLSVPRVAASNDNGGESITLAPVYHIDARGSSLSEGQIRALLDANNRKLKKDLPAMLGNARRRGAM